MCGEIEEMKIKEGRIRQVPEAKTEKRWSQKIANCKFKQLRKDKSYLAKATEAQRCAEIESDKGSR